MKILSVLLASLVFLTVAQISAGAATATLTVNLDQQNKSGESGTATLTQAGANVDVVVALKGTPAGTPQPMHIHTGSCSDLGGVAYPLTSVAGGTSTTTVKSITIDQLLAKPYAINVHMSADNLGKYVACGNLKVASAM